ncbi:MAG TPA: hypothetical protein VMJ12_03875 [Candidatus Acidoferrales bacterium]|nr:hypothetical protein [Candidatus Acidoferrales bacterium]
MKMLKKPLLVIPLCVLAIAVIVVFSTAYYHHRARFHRLLAGFNARPATWYVDSSATGTHDGTSWATAWSSFGQLSGISAGDTVYISGGPSGTTQSYAASSSIWPGGNGCPPNGGRSGPSVVYKIGQDSLHNGTAIFDGGGAGYLIYTYSSSAGFFTFSGDAGDGKRHIALTNFTASPFVIPLPGVRLSYINFGSVGEGVNGQGLTQFELDNCYCNIIGNTADHFLSMGFNDQAYDATVISNNVIYVPHGSSSTCQSGDGADCFQIGGGGYSLYNNQVHGYDSGYNTTAQHQDGYQSETGANIKIIGNWFDDCGNSSIFLDVIGTQGFTNVIIANNVCTIKSAWTYAANGVLLLPQNGTTTCYFQNICIANNTFADYNIGSSGGFAMNIGSVTDPGSWIGVLVENNIYINSQTVFHAPNTDPVTNIDNVSFTSSQATNAFASYQLAGANNDYHLLGSDSSMIGQGQNLTKYFTTDKDGKQRSSAAAWNIGAY